MTYRATTFIIIELIKGTTFDKSMFARPKGSLHPVLEYYDLIAEGIQLLHRMPVPPDVITGLYTLDHRLRRIRHLLFKEYRAHAIYQNVDKLEAHINKVRAHP